MEFGRSFPGHFAGPHGEGSNQPSPVFARELRNWVQASINQNKGFADGSRDCVQLVSFRYVQAMSAALSWFSSSSKSQGEHV